MSHSTPFDARAHLMASLPYRPHAGNAKDTFVRQENRADALKCRYIAIDPPPLIIALKFDLDKKSKSGESMAVNFLDAGLPQPHFIIQRRGNLGAQYIYLLVTPVARSMCSRAGPRKLMQSVVNGFTAALNADRGYTGHGVKNPFHRAWDTYINNAPPFELLDLLHCLPETLRHTPKREAVAGEGRNTDLFDVTRDWAYSNITAAYEAGDFWRWQQAVIEYATQQNCYSPALPRSEVASVAKSVYNWVWANALNFGRDGGKQYKRRDLPSWSRPALTAEQAELNRAEGRRQGGILGAPITHAIRRSETHDCITGAIGQLAAQGVQNPTHAQIADLAGVHRDTIRRFMRASRLGANSN